MSAVGERAGLAEVMPEPETIELDGFALRIVRGGRTAGVPILLTSAWPQSLYAFRKVWTQLAELGPLVAVDLPGFGRSDANPTALSPAGMGAFIIRLLDRMGIERCHAVGPDVGTAAMLFAAHDAPDLFATITIGSGGTDMSLVGERLRGIIEGRVEGLDVGKDARVIVDGIKALGATEPRPMSWRTTASLPRMGGIERRRNMSGPIQAICRSFRLSPGRSELRSWSSRARPTRWCRLPTANCSSASFLTADTWSSTPDTLSERTPPPNTQTSSPPGSAAAATSTEHFTSEKRHATD
ncbi:alpha/beta fold hydrolase [Novosphingobium sp.]|uniref:alpha/beta fold hydrolase n=1 Tax=Novosphingobium sp. TaxID=1874826 RepID=UPI003D6D149D